MMDKRQKRDAEEPLWTVADVANRLKVSRSSVYRMAAAGEIPQVKLGGVRSLVRFDGEEIEKWINSKRS